ncbi:MAG: sodium:alanine symporter family protein, partial [Synechococcus sp.]
MEQLISSINDPINGVVWGWPMVLLIAFTGIVLMLGLRFMPLQRLPYGVRMLWQREEGQNEGDITPFQALMTSLSATIGTG